MSPLRRDVLSDQLADALVENENLKCRFDLLTTFISDFRRRARDAEYEAKHPEGANPERIAAEERGHARAFHAAAGDLEAALWPEQHSGGEGTQ